MNMIKGTCAFVGFLIVPLASLVDAQEKLRIIQESTHKTSPVVVVGRKIGDKRVDRSFENRHGIVAGPGWIQALNLDLKNVSHKNINYIHVELVIPRTGKMEHSGRIVSIFFGKRAASASSTASNDQTSKQELLLPGDVVKVRIGDTERARVGDYLKENDAEDVERITIDIREVHFDDGTVGRWELNCCRIP